MKNILLTEEDLKNLLSGKVVKIDENHQIALEDMGYDRIIKAILEKM